MLHPSIVNGVFLLSGMSLLEKFLSGKVLKFRLLKRCLFFKDYSFLWMIVTMARSCLRIIEV